MGWLHKWFGKSNRRQSYVPSVEELGARCVPSAGFVQTNLISNIAGLAQITDANLVNPWGLASTPSGALLISNNNAGVATGHEGEFPAVAVPGRSWTGSPTGVVFNPGQGFAISKGRMSASSL